VKRLVVAFAAIFVCGSLQAAPPSQAPVVFIQSIPLAHVEGRIDHLAFEQRSQQLLVAALGNDTVEVIDTRAGRVTHTLPGFREPQGIEVAPEAGVVGVANGEGTGVQLLDAKDFHRGKNVTLGDDADDMRLEGGQFYVGYGSGAIAAIDPVRGVVTGTATLPGHPEAFSLEQSGTRIFVNVPSAGRIAVIDQRTMRVVDNWPVTSARDNYPMALDEAHHRLFVGCRDPARVLVYDTRSGRMIDSFVAVADTDDLFYDSTRNRLYVSGGQGYLDVFEAPPAGGGFARRAHVPTAAGARTSLFVPAQNRMYVAVPHRGAQRAEIRVYAVH
jgi:DNA-binding beta-propeller fold protein YncE